MRDPQLLRRARDFPYQPLHSGNAIQLWAWSIVLGVMIGIVAYYVWRLP